MVQEVMQWHWSAVLRFATARASDLFYGIFFFLIIAYLVLILWLQWKEPVRVLKNNALIRRVFYVGYLVLMAIGFITGYVAYRDWKLLAEFTALMVFIDLAVFQTPNIMKIWSAEFQHDDQLRQLVDEATGAVQKHSLKSEALALIVQDTEDYFLPKMAPTKWNIYRDELEQYLTLYSDRVGIDARVFQLESAQGEDDLKKRVEKALKNVEFFHGFPIPVTLPKDSTEQTRETVIDCLIKGNSVLLRNDKHAIIPIFKKSSLLITLSSRSGKIADLDISHVISLHRIFEWYMVQ